MSGDARKSSLQEVSKLKEELATEVLTSSVDLKPKAMAAQKNLAGSRAEVEVLRAEVQSCRDQIANN